MLFERASYNQKTDLFRVEYHNGINSNFFTTDEEEASFSQLLSNALVYIQIDTIQKSLNSINNAIENAQEQGRTASQIATLEEDADRLEYILLRWKNTFPNYAWTENTAVRTMCAVINRSLGILPKTVYCELDRCLAVIENTENNTQTARDAMTKVLDATFGNCEGFKKIFCRMSADDLKILRSDLASGRRKHTKETFAQRTTMSRKEKMIEVLFEIFIQIGLEAPKK